MLTGFFFGFEAPEVGGEEGFGCEVDGASSGMSVLVGVFIAGPDF